MNTREKILKEALRLFAEKGYSDVFVGEIASAVGIKAPSLYKHFKSKQEIFDAIINMLKESYNAQANALSINGSDNRADADIYSSVSEEMLVEMTKNLFLYFLHDENVRLFRRLLTLEQYKNTELAKLYSKQYADDVIEYQSGLFSIMIDRGIFRCRNAKIMALQFYSPIYLLLTLCDIEPKREQEALEALNAHIKQFNELYRAEEK